MNLERLNEVKLYSVTNALLFPVSSFGLLNDEFDFANIESISLHLFIIVSTRLV